MNNNRVTKQSQGVRNESQDSDGEIKNKKFSVQGHLLIINSVNVCDLSGVGLSGRGAVKAFTPSSGARMRKYLRTTVADYKVFITLTYPHNYERDGRQSKEQLRRFIQELKRNAVRNYKDMQKWGVFWFMEFQERGAIHYHLFCTDEVDRKWLSLVWYDICGTEDKRHLAAGTNIERIKSGRHGTCAYASKYAAKSEQKVIPDDIKNAGRFWGVSGERRTVSADTVLTQETMGLRVVEEVLHSIKVEIKEAIREGNARYVVKKDDVMVLYMAKMHVEARILYLVRKLERVASIYQVMPGMALLPEYEIKSDFGKNEGIDYDISLL